MNDILKKVFQVISMKNTFNFTKEQIIEFNKAVVLFKVLNDKNDLIDKTKLRVLAF